MPAYHDYMRKGKRAEGVSTLLAMQMAQEKYRANNTQYGNLTQMWGGVNASENGYYGLAISGTSATGFTLTATGQGDQANDSEGSTHCGTLTLVVNGATTTKSPAACW